MDPRSPSVRMPRRRSWAPAWPASLALLSAAACGDFTGPGGTLEAFVESDGASLHYRIDFPDGAGPFATVVLGAGAGDVPLEHPDLASWAERWVGLGYAAARYDKRGTGRSGGILRTLGTENGTTLVPRLARDMIAVVHAVQEHERVDRARLGLFGASQANWYMPVVATETPEVGFMVVLTGGFMPVGPKYHWEDLRAEGLDPFGEEIVERWRAYEGPLSFDQRPFLRALDRPMLYLLGDRDPGVPVGLAREELARLRADGVDVTLETYAGGGHLLPGIDYWRDVGRWLRGPDD